MSGTASSEQRQKTSEWQELDLYQASLPVRLIATARLDFMTCEGRETLGVVRVRNAEDAFDYLPVIGAVGEVIGVLDVHATNALPDAVLVEAAYERIGERFLMGAETSIFDFLQQADKRPFRFVVTTDGISGLVSLSDVQKLPVRAALFAMVTQLEIAMSGLIAVHFKDNSWLNILSDGRRKKLSDQLEVARESNNQVSPLLYTQFADKIRITCEIWKRFGDRGVLHEVRSELAGFEKLRNAVAHANELGVTREAAVNIAKKARAMRLWLDHIENMKNASEGRM